MNNNTIPAPQAFETSDPDKNQDVTAYQVAMQTFNKVLLLERDMSNLLGSMQTLTATLAAHVKQNIDTFQSIQEYIGDQMSYRLFRQNLEENKVSLELAQKSLELEFAQKRLTIMEQEQKEDTEETDRLRYEYQKQTLEIESIKKNLEILQNVKHSTQDKIKSVKTQPAQNEMQKKIKDTILFTAVGTVTAATVGGTIAFIVWLARFYVQNTP